MFTQFYKWHMLAKVYIFITRKSLFKKYDICTRTQIRRYRANEINDKGGVISKVSLGGVLFFAYFYVTTHILSNQNIFLNVCLLSVI